MIIRTLLRHAPPTSLTPRFPPISSLTSRRSFATPLSDAPARPSADAAVEELQELYATAKDEFEIAHEETTKKTVYAASDRAAAHEELSKLKHAFTEKVRGARDEEVGKEITRRVGQRVRELERAVEAMEEMAKED
ncbi:MAG: hypothetical protein HETSPECPRED_008420 [Heterodermia speciosa]|uniref:Uncharacterized protein n=1 Tax=Heterodermia speciosa TaxID=116794 RepID=A0A8H3FXU7_9LECA|nr:MAG: hypothetical protein HETSPECPRED_008420 [Heterodermia speciosa]